MIAHRSPRATVDKGKRKFPPGRLLPIASRTAALREEPAPPVEGAI